MKTPDPKTDQLIKNALEFDSLDEAEKLTGRSYKTDDGVTFLGMGLLQINSEDRKRLFTETDDTMFSNDVDRYLRIVKEEGFEIVLCDQFQNYQYPDKIEKFYVLFNYEKGILLEFDTYGGHVNSGKYFYNWKPSYNPFDDAPNKPRVTSSGSYFKFEDGSYGWAGDHDCREALRFNIRQLQQHGTFITPWVKDPYFRLLNFTEWHDVTTVYSNHSVQSAEIKRISAERICRLPEAVRKAIGVELTDAWIKENFLMKREDQSAS